MTKIVCQLDPEGYFIGPAIADESPLEPGVWLLPAGAADAQLPTVPDGYRAKWNGSGFDTEEIPVDPPPEPPTIEARRAAVWDRVKSERSRREYGGVQAAGHWFQTDMESQIKHQSNLIDAKEILAGGGTTADVMTIGGQPVGWKTFDNGIVPMTVGLALAIAGAIKIQTALSYARGQVLYAEIMAAENPEAIDITTGWPTVFEG